MKHTPGPWKIIEGSTCLHVESEDRAFSTGCLCFRDADPWANARLIAAAPNLLAALKATLATLEEAAALIVADPGHSVGQAAQMEMIRRKAEATIAKAEGTVKVD